MRYNSGDGRVLYITNYYIWNILNLKIINNKITAFINIPLLKQKQISQIRSPQRERKPKKQCVCVCVCHKCVHVYVLIASVKRIDFINATLNKRVKSNKTNKVHILLECDKLICCGDEVIAHIKINEQTTQKINQLISRSKQLRFLLGDI